ncbi:glycerate kinase [Egicoccus sp. AB-alg6-2]|uniref:glycerate kinase n=1 Tax=Egicoccus sp. AB-alg6-2 TaxID=3242692 RepID=UPI00359E3224
MQVLVVAEPTPGVAAPAVASLVRGVWRRHAPADDVVALPVTLGGPGVLETLAGPDDTWLVTEAAGPHGHPVEAALLLREDGTALVEAARVAAGALAPGGSASVGLATTYGVGELLQAARDADARRILVDVAQVAAVDGGAGALTALGWRLRVEDGSGLKIGASDLPRVRAVEPGWSQDWSGVDVQVLTEHDATLLEAPEHLAADVEIGGGEAESLTAGLHAWAEVASRDLQASAAVVQPGSGAGGGLAFGLAAALGADLVRGADVLWDLQRVDAAIAASDLVLVAASPAGAVGRRTLDTATRLGVACHALPDLGEGLAGVAEAEDAAAALVEVAQRHVDTLR